jgi:hypothetical protein
MRITMVCDKDPALARWIEEIFGIAVEAFYQKWALEMATLHAHYDFEMVEGRRRPIIEDGKPKLLTPTLVIEIEDP